MFRYPPIEITDFRKRSDRPPHLVGRRVAEEVEEDGWGKRVELGEGGPALGADFVGLVQDRRDSPLFLHTRNGNLKFGDILFVDLLERSALALR